MFETTPPELASPLDRAQSFGISALVWWLELLVRSLNDLLALLRAAQTPLFLFFTFSPLGKEKMEERGFFFQCCQNGETGLEKQYARIAIRRGVVASLGVSCGFHDTLVFFVCVCITK